MTAITPDNIYGSAFPFAIDGRNGIGDGFSPSDELFETGTGKSNVLSAKTTQILSYSATDPDIKDALTTFPYEFDQNTAETRRKLRVQVFQDTVLSNASIIKDFGLIASVRYPFILPNPLKFKLQNGGFTVG